MEADRLVPQPAAGEAVAAPTPPPQAAAAHDQDHMAGGDEVCGMCVVCKAQMVGYQTRPTACRRCTDSTRASHHPILNQQPSTLPASTATVLRKIQKWWDYKSAGDVIAGSRLIPMKTPLTRELQARPARLEATARARSGSVDGSGGGGGVAPGQEPAGEQREHTIGGFIAEQAAQGRTVGLIVDLSNHESLYADDLARECPGLAYQHFHFGPWVQRGWVDRWKITNERIHHHMA